MEPFYFSFFSVSGWGIDLDFCDIEWFALEMSRDHPVVFEFASKYCNSDSFVDHDGYSAKNNVCVCVCIHIYKTHTHSSNECPKLEPIIQSEVSQKEKHQYSALTHIYVI